jgi:hypothetical protein
MIRVAAPPSTSTKKMRSSEAKVLEVKIRVKTKDARMCFSMEFSGGEVIGLV